MFSKGKVEQVVRNVKSGVAVTEAYEPIFQVGEIDGEVVLFTPMLKDSPLEKDLDFVTFTKYVRDEFLKSDVRTTLKVRAKLIDGVLVLFSPCVDKEVKEAGYESVKDLLKKMK